MKCINHDNDAGLENDFPGDSYSISQQNKDLFKIVNNLREEKAWFDSKEYASILSNITNHMLKHFETEEAYMEKYGYTDIEAHKKDHQEFICQVIHLSYNLNYKVSSSAWQAYLYIVGWLVNHELLFGIKLKEFIDSKTDTGELDIDVSKKSNGRVLPLICQEVSTRKF